MLRNCFWHSFYTHVRDDKLNDLPNEANSKIKADVTREEQIDFSQEDELINGNKY